MKILISTTNIEIGGAQVFILNLANALSEKYKVYIYDHRPEDRNHEIIQHLLSKNVKLISFASNRFLLKVIWKINKILNQIGLKINFRDIIYKLHLKYTLKRIKPNIIHSHLNLSDVNISNVISKENSVFVTTLHGCYDINSNTKNNPYNLNAINSIPKIIKKLGAIVYLTDKNLDAFKPYLKEKDLVIKKIYNGFKYIDERINFNKSYIRKKLNINENDIIFVMVGRGIKEKGWEEAIKAFNIVKYKTKRKVFLFLIGDGTFIDYLKEKYEDRTIIFLGKHHNPIEIIAECNIGLLPSYSEALPNVIVEYIYCGLPVIATNVGEIKNMITYDNQMAGIIIDLEQNGKPDIQKIVDAMLFYIENETERIRQGELAKKCSEKFSMKKCIDEYISLYDELFKVLPLIV
jgi:glycosyltransferase involved in cell wall biosynthesis